MIFLHEEIIILHNFLDKIKIFVEIFKYLINKNQFVLVFFTIFGSIFSIESFFDALRFNNVYVFFYLSDCY